MSKNDSIFDSLDDDEKDALESRSFPKPAHQDPMLATLTDERFSDPDWIFERKLDGERCLVFHDGDDLHLFSRNHEQLNVTYPDLVDAFQNHPVDEFVVDGEIVAFEGDTTSFSRLQERMHVKDAKEAKERAEKVAVYFYAFDLLHLSGYDTTGLTLRSRKALLQKTLDYDRNRLRFLTHRNEKGESFFEEACDNGWEGVIAKDATSKYVQTRSKKWLKFKCVNRQEFVVGGFTEPEGERIGFGALLLGFYRDDELVYAGKVGTGFDDETLQDLRDRLETIEVDEPAYHQGELPEDAHWVKPQLVAEIGFTEWTDDDRLRHPRYLGLRRDKDPGDVVKETPN